MRFKGLKSNKWAESWDNAFPIGNGTIGGLVFGNPLHEVIATNHEELYLPTEQNADSQPFKGAHLLEGMRKLLLEGKYREASDYYLEGLGSGGTGFENLIWTNPFETATELYIDVDAAEPARYYRRLDFTNGECKIGTDKFTRKAFVSRTRNVLALETNCKEGVMDLHIHTGVNKEIHDMDSVENSIEEGFIVDVGTHSIEESGYISITRVITDGKLEEEEFEGGRKGFFVKGATKVVVLYTLTPWKTRMEAEKVKAIRIIKDTPDDYRELLKEHKTIHRELFERVRVTLSEEDEEYTNEEIREMCKENKLAPEFLERMADFGRYLEIASFGKLPPNLQGVWSGTANPPWSADYTLDENVQMMMWQVLPGSLPELARVYFDWLESYTDDFKANAMAYYGAQGVFSACRASSDGFSRHFCTAFPMVFWTAGAGWLSSVYEDYYEYTGDKNVLLRGVKYWKEVVKFYEDFLITDDKGKFVFAPSYSPENTPLGHDCPLAINSTMDVAVAKEVYKNLINACEILDIEEESIALWKDEYAKFPEYTVNSDGALKEWLPMELTDDYHHRHSSHLYPVFPGHEALEEGNEELLSACHMAARYRLLDGVDAISGWGLAHLANISARLKDSTLWYMALNRLVQKFTLENFFTGHNEHSLFQMDANLGITAALYEAFVYSDMEKVELFPVITDALDYMQVEGLRAKGSMHIISLKKQSDLVIAHLENQGKNTMRVIAPRGYSFEDGDREIELAPGEVVLLKAIKRA